MQIELGFSNTLIKRKSFFVCFLCQASKTSLLPVFSLLSPPLWICMDLNPWLQYLGYRQQNHNSVDKNREMSDQLLISCKQLTQCQSHLTWHSENHAIILIIFFQVHSFKETRVITHLSLHPRLEAICLFFPLSTGLHYPDPFTHNVSGWKEYLTMH